MRGLDPTARTQAQAEQAKPLAQHGANQHVATLAAEVKPLASYGGVGDYQLHSASDSGTTSDYLTARIARDRPDILERIKGRRKEQQRAIILRLSMLGWTQQEIAGVVGVSQMEVSRSLNEMAELPKSLKSILDSGIPHLDVAERFNLPLQTVWAIDLDERDCIPRGAYSPARRQKQRAKVGRPALESRTFPGRSSHFLGCENRVIAHTSSSDR